MTKIIDWRREVLSELPVEEDIFIEKYLMDAISDLCKRTDCLQETISDVSVIGNPDHLLVPLTANSKLVSFLYAKYSGRVLKNKTAGEMVSFNPRWEEASGTPNYTIYNGGNTVRWDKKPTIAGDSVEFIVSITPTSITDSDIPIPIEHAHLETVKDYVKWKFYLQPQIFNERLAGYHEKRYEDGRGKLRVSVLTNYTGSLSVAFQRL